MPETPFYRKHITKKANITVDLQGHKEDIRTVTAALAALLAYPLNA